MGRIEKMKRLIIEQANKRILGEQHENEEGCPCDNGIYSIMCCDIELNHADSESLHHLLNSHPESHTFMDSLNHNVHAHLGPNNHLSLEFPHLGSHHNIELDLEGSYPTPHDGHNEHGETHSDFGMLPHIVIGGGLKIPVSFGKHHTSHH